MKRTRPYVTNAYSRSPENDPARILIKLRSRYQIAERAERVENRGVSVPRENIAGKNTTLGESAERELHRFCLRTLLAEIKDSQRERRNRYGKGKRKKQNTLPLNRHKKNK